MKNAILKKLPHIYGMVLFAGKRDEFTELLEEVYEKDIFTLKPFIDFDEDEFKLEPNGFDFVLSFNVIEKLFNPKHYLRNLHWGLSMSGTLVLITPTPKFIWGKEHFHEFDRKRLLKLMKSSGFKIKKIKKFGKILRKYWYLEATK